MYFLKILLKNNVVDKLKLKFKKMKIKIDLFANICNNIDVINIIFSSIEEMKKIKFLTKKNKDKNYFLEEDKEYIISNLYKDNNNIKVNTSDINIYVYENIHKLYIENFSLHDTTINLKINNKKILNKLKLININNANNSVLSVDFFSLSHYSNESQFNLDIKNNTIGDLIVKNILIKNEMSVINNSMGNLILENIYAKHLKLNNNSGGEVSINKNIINNIFINNNSIGVIYIKDVLSNNCVLKNNSVGKIQCINNKQFSSIKIDNYNFGVVMTDDFK